MRLHRSSKTTTDATPLLKWPCGIAARVLRLEGDDEFKNRLRELGLCESAQVSVLQVNGSVLCQVQSSRFGLSRSAAEAVIVGEIA